MKRFLEFLRKINTFMLSSYLIYLVIDFQDFFHSKDQSGIAFFAILLFFTTFICGGIILVYASRKDIESSISLDDIKQFKAKNTFWGIICAIEIVILLLFLHQEIVIWCVAVLIISFGFTIAERAIIPQIVDATIYKISVNPILIPVPFVFFIGGNLYASDHLAEEVFDKAAIIIFITAGLMMMYGAWHSYYVVDDEAKTIEKNYGILDFFKKEKDIFKFEEIEYYKKEKLYYIIYTDNKAYKISRFYTSTKRLEGSFEEFGVAKREL